MFAKLGWTALRWPNPQTLDKATDWLGGAFTVVADETRSFTYPIDTDFAARQFVGSLYLPDVSQARWARAERVASDWIDDRIGVSAAPDRRSARLIADGRTQRRSRHPGQPRARRAPRTRMGAHGGGTAAG